MAKQLAVTKSSGNVFRDLGVPAPEIHQLKADLCVLLIRLIARRELTQVRAAALLGIRQPELSRIKGGDLSHYSVERLLGFLQRLDQRIEITVRPSTSAMASEIILKV